MAITTDTGLVRHRWAVLLISVLGVRYLHWRLSATLNFSTAQAGGLSLLLLACEALLLASNLLQLWFSLAPEEPPQPGQLSAAPAVDVLLPSCGEPLAVVERSLRSCLALDYPRFTVWLLDDAARSELQQLAERLGCRYLQRKGGRHAKAGNLNHALPHLQGELIAVFDADVVPQQIFLRRTVPAVLEDQRTALVQTPQSYMNADPVLRNLRLERWVMPDEESFYRWVEPSRQGVGAVVCAGTSFLVRRQALLEVGGFETATPSEDLATGIRLAAHGYRLRYLNEKLSAGLAPHNAATMARQRCRWASGTLQTLFTGANPLTIKGLNPLQRLAYLEGIVHWLNVLPQLLLLLMPLLAVLSRSNPLLLTPNGLLQVALPFYLSQMLLARWFSNHARGALLPELYRWIFLVPLVAAVLSTLAGRPRSFRVTPKAPSAEQRWQRPSMGLLLPLLILSGVQLVAATGLLIWPPPLSTTVLTLVWISASSLLLLTAMRSCWDRPGTSAVPWFAVQQPLSWGVVTAISETGLEARLNSAQLPEQHWGLPLLLQRQHGKRVGMTWGELSEAERQWLQQRLYGRQRCWPQRRAPFEGRVIWRVALRALLPVPKETWFRRSLMPLDLSPQGLDSSPLTQASRPSPINESASTRMNMASPG